jgi:NADPH:quinone reductase-like Zn-dependent oxidoreductase
MPADEKLVLKPGNIGFEEGAVIPFGGTTAYDFLINKAKLQPGEKVLINGASGSVGSACVHIAKHCGADVTGVCSGTNAPMVMALGADRVVDYHKQEFEKEGIQYDIIVDTVGTSPFVRANRALRPGGRMVLIAGKTSDMFLDGLKARRHGKRMIGRVAKESRAILQTVVDLAAEGHFKPVIDRCYSFNEMQSAHAHVDTGHTKGNVAGRVAPQIGADKMADKRTQTSEMAHA